MASRLDAAPGPDDGPNMRMLFPRVLSFQGETDGHLVLEAEQLTHSWVQSTGLHVPTLVKAQAQYHEHLKPALQPARDDSFDLSLLPSMLVVKEAKDSKIRRLEDQEVTTLDIMRQAPGPRWSIRQWCLYWKDRQVEPYTGTVTTGPLETLPGESAGMQGGVGQSQLVRQHSDVVAHISAGGSEGKQGLGDEDDEADSAFVHQGAVDQFIEQSAPRKGIRDVNKKRLISMTCLCLANTPLASQLAPPAAITAVDMLRTVHQQIVLSQFPYRHYLACHPAGAVLNFQTNATGATAWCHVVLGSLVLLLVPPSAHNLAVYATWAQKGPKKYGMLLAEACQGVMHVQVGVGESVIIPGGWPYCMAAVQDTLLVGSQLLTLHNTKMQLACWELEEMLQVPTRARFPSFKHISWHVALHYAKVLRVATGLHKGQKPRMTSSKDQGAVAPTPTASHNQNFGAFHSRRAAAAANTTRTDSASGWAAPSIEEGDYAMSAHKRPRNGMREAAPTELPIAAVGRLQRMGSDGQGGPAAAGMAQLAGSDADGMDVDSNLLYAGGRLKRLRNNAGDAVSMQPMQSLEDDVSFPAADATAAPRHPQQQQQQQGDMLEQPHDKSRTRRAHSCESGGWHAPPKPAASDGSGMQGSPAAAAKARQVAEISSDDEVGPQQGNMPAPTAAAVGVVSQQAAGPAPVRIKIKPRAPSSALPAQHLNRDADQGTSPLRAHAHTDASGGRALQRQDAFGRRAGAASAVAAAAAAVLAEEEEQSSQEQDSDVLAARRSRRTARSNRAQGAAAGSMRGRTRRPARRDPDYDFDEEEGESSEGEGDGDGNQSSGSNDSDKLASGIQEVGSDDYGTMSSSEQGGAGSDVSMGAAPVQAVATRPRRTHRRAAAAALGGLEGMMQAAVKRRGAEAAAWDTLKARQEQARAQKATVTPGQRAQIKGAAAWSDDDSDPGGFMPLQPALPAQPQASRRVKRGGRGDHSEEEATGRKHSRAQPARQRRRPARWEDVEYFDEAAGGSGSEGSEGNWPASYNASTQAAQQRQPAGCGGIKLKLHVGKGKAGGEPTGGVLGNTGVTAQLPQGGINRSHASPDREPDLHTVATGAPSPVKPLRIKLKGAKAGVGDVLPDTAGQNMIPQTDGACDTWLTYHGRQLAGYPWPLIPQTDGAGDDSDGDDDMLPQHAAKPVEVASAPAMLTSEATAEHTAGEGLTTPAKPLVNPFEMPGALPQAAQASSAFQARLDDASNDRALQQVLSPTPSQILMPPPPTRVPVTRTANQLGMVREEEEEQEAVHEEGCDTVTPTSTPLAPARASHADGDGVAGAGTGHHDDTHDADQKLQPLALSAGHFEAQDAHKGTGHQQAEQQHDKQHKAPQQHAIKCTKTAAAGKAAAKPHFKNISDAAPTASKVSLVALGSGQHRARQAPSLKGAAARKVGTVGVAPHSATMTGGVHSTFATPAAEGTATDAKHMPSQADQHTTTVNATVSAPTDLAHSAAGAHAKQDLQEHGQFSRTSHQLPVPCTTPEGPLHNVSGTSLHWATAASLPTANGSAVGGGTVATTMPELLPHATPGAVGSAMLPAGSTTPAGIHGAGVLPTLTVLTQPGTSAMAGFGAGGTPGHLLPGATTPHAVAAQPISLSAWELASLPVLLGTLRHWQTEHGYRDELPFSLKDPGALLDQLEEVIAKLTSNSAAGIGLTGQQGISFWPHANGGQYTVGGLLGLGTSQRSSLQGNSMQASHSAMAAQPPAILQIAWQQSGMLAGVATANNTGAQPMDVDELPQPPVGQTAAAQLAEQLVAQQGEWPLATSLARQSSLSTTGPGLPAVTSNALAAPGGALTAARSGSMGQAGLSAGLPLSTASLPEGPEMMVEGTTSSGLQLKRPKLEYAPMSMLPVSWQHAIRRAGLEGMNARPAGVSECPSSVMVDMDVGVDLDEVVEENEALLAAAAPVGTGKAAPGGRGKAGGTTQQGVGGGGVSMSAGGVPVSSGTIGRPAGTLGVKGPAPGPSGGGVGGGAGAATASKKLTKLKASLGLKRH